MTSDEDYYEKYGDMQTAFDDTVRHDSFAVERSGRFRRKPSRFKKSSGAGIDYQGPRCGTAFYPEVVERSHDQLMDIVQTAGEHVVELAELPEKSNADQLAILKATLPHLIRKQ